MYRSTIVGSHRASERHKARTLRHLKTGEAQSPPVPTPQLRDWISSSFQQQLGVLPRERQFRIRLTAIALASLYATAGEYGLVRLCSDPARASAMRVPPTLRSPQELQPWKTAQLLRRVRSEKQTNMSTTMCVDFHNCHVHGGTVKSFVVIINAQAEHTANCVGSFRLKPDVSKTCRIWSTTLTSSCAWSCHPTTRHWRTTPCGYTRHALWCSGKKSRATWRHDIDADLLVGTNATHFVLGNTLANKQDTNSPNDVGRETPQAVWTSHVHGVLSLEPSPEPTDRIMKSRSRHRHSGCSNTLTMYWNKSHPALVDVTHRNCWRAGGPYNKMRKRMPETPSSTAE